MYRLQNVDLLDAGDAERMRAQEPNIIAIARALGLKLRRDWQDAGRLPELAIEAWRRGLISTGRAGQLIGADIAGIMRRMKVLGIRREDGAGPVTGVVIS